MRHGVKLLIELKLEILTQLLPHRRLHRLQHINEHAKARGVILVVLAALEHTGAHQARVPPIHVPADDVRGWVVADHVDVGRQLLVVVDLLHPAGNHFVGVLVRCEFGLAIDDALEVHAGERFVHGFEADAECALGHAGEGVLGRAEQVSLRKVDGDAGRDGVLSAGSETAVLRLQQVHDDLHVGGVVARVGEDHDGVDVGLGEIAGREVLRSSSVKTR